MSKNQDTPPKRSLPRKAIDKTKSFFISLKENFNPRQQAQRIIQGNSGTLSDQLRNNGFLFDIYNEKELTPHEEMRMCEVAYRKNSYVVAGVELFAQVIMGKDLRVETVETEADQETKKKKEYVNQKIIPKLKNPFKIALEEMIKTGNGYLYITKKNQKGTPTEFTALSRSHHVYIDFDKTGKPTRYIYKMPEQGKYNYKTHTVPTYNGPAQITGVSLEPENIIHLKYGKSHSPVYGRSNLASSVDDINIAYNLEKNLSIIARNKGINRKIISINDSEGDYIPEEEMSTIQREYNRLDESQNFLLSNYEVDVKDLNYAGTHYNPDEDLKRLMKKITMMLGPSFYFHGDSTVHSVTEGQKDIYKLTIENFRDTIKPVVNELIDKILTQQFGSTAPHGVSLTFGEYTFTSEKEKSESVIKKFQAGVITLNEAREELGLSLDEEVGEFYRFDLDNSKNAQSDAGVLNDFVDLEKKTQRTLQTFIDQQKK